MITDDLPSLKTLSPAELVRTAVLAPSPDNNQPWKFVSHEDRLEVFLDPAHALPSDVHSMHLEDGYVKTVEKDKKKGVTEEQMDAAIKYILSAPAE